MEEIAPNIFIETAYEHLTVGAVRTSEGWVCIDSPPIPVDARDWRAALHAIDDQPVRFVINTDAHRDRILGNGRFNVPVIAHQAAAAHVLNLPDNYVVQAAKAVTRDDQQRAGFSGLPLVPPQISCSTSLTVHSGETELTLISQPSATPGSVWVEIESQQVMFVGDTALVAHHPFIRDCVSKEWLDLLRHLRHDRYQDWIVVSGRDGVIDPEDTEQLSEYLRVARRRVFNLLRADGSRSELGEYVDELLAFFPVPAGRDEAVRARVLSGLDSIYEELLREAQQEDDADED